MTTFQNPFVDDIKPAIQAALEGLRSQVDIAVIGLSGGADSTLCACLCQEALGAQNVYGLSMPCSRSDEKTFNARSKALASMLGIHHYDASIRGPFHAMLEAFSVSLPHNAPAQVQAPSVLNQGNARSRLRMVMLYLHCAAIGEANPGKRVRVIGTGNLSEDYIGYDTKWGDGACDIFPIADFFKREVYMALEAYRDRGILAEDLIDRNPSAGLWEGQTDEGELGYSYDEMAPAILFCKEFLEFLPNHVLPPDVPEVVHFVWSRHLSNMHKVRPAGLRTIFRSFEAKGA